MKRLGFIALLIFSAVCLNAQSLTDCENVVKETVSAINSYSSEAIQPYLSADFECSGQKGDVANLVLNATIEKLKQLNDSIMKYERASESRDGNMLTLVYCKHSIKYDCQFD